MDKKGAKVTRFDFFDRDKATKYGIVPALVHAYLWRKCHFIPRFNNEYSCVTVSEIAKHYPYLTEEKVREALYTLEIVKLIRLYDTRDEKGTKRFEIMR